MGLDMATTHFWQKTCSPALSAHLAANGMQHWSHQDRAKIGPCVEDGLGISLLWMKYINVAFSQQSPHISHVQSQDNHSTQLLRTWC